MGFCTEVSENVKAAACIRDNTMFVNGIEIAMDKFRNAEAVRDIVAEEAEEPADDVIEEIAPAKNAHSNGAEPQPVDADIHNDSKLIERRLRLVDIYATTL